MEITNKTFAALDGMKIIISAAGAEVASGKSVKVVETAEIVKTEAGYDLSADAGNALIVEMDGEEVMRGVSLNGKFIATLTEVAYPNP